MKKGTNGRKVSGNYASHGRARPDKKKVLLMGRSEAGKTSMRSIIFANYIARDTRRLGATMDVEQSNVRFLNNLVLNLWDCGGQDAFMETFFTSQKDVLFSNVEVLIFVFDVQSSDVQKDIEKYQSCIETGIMKYSPDAMIFCLVHKMDLIPKAQREMLFSKRKEELEHLSKPLKISCYATSIWDETLYNAWSKIMSLLIPNVGQLKLKLKKFADHINADEVLLFEKATFLVVAHHMRKEHNDANRFEKISNIIKQFKLSCNKMQSFFRSIEVRNSSFAAYIELFTANMYIMVVMSDPQVCSAAVQLNINNAKRYFKDTDQSGTQ